MNLTTTPEAVNWPELHYVFIEKIGPFETNAPRAWQELHRVLGDISRDHHVGRYFAAYKRQGQTYRAGVSVAAKPDQLPSGLSYENLAGGKYARFTLTGSYSNLGPATRRVFEIATETHLALRDAYNIENYVNNPQTTPEDQLITEILVPTI